MTTVVFETCEHLLQPSDRDRTRAHIHTGASNVRICCSWTMWLSTRVCMYWYTRSGLDSRRYLPGSLQVRRWVRANYGAALRVASTSTIQASVEEKQRREKNISSRQLALFRNNAFTIEFQGVFWPSFQESRTDRLWGISTCMNYPSVGVSDWWSSIFYFTKNNS